MNVIRLKSDLKNDLRYKHEIFPINTNEPVKSNQVNNTKHFNAINA